MFATNGVEVDSWVQVDGRGQVSYEVVGDEAQLRFGSVRSSGLTLVLAEHALEELATTAGAALRQLRGEHPATGGGPPSQGLGGPPGPRGRRGPRGGSPGARGPPGPGGR